MSSNVDVKQALSHKFADGKASYNRRDAILYALGVGATDLKFVYELDDSFSILPTYPVVLGQKGASYDIVPFGANMELPGINFDPMMILHGEQYLEINKHPLPLQANWITKPKIIGVYDKGKGALVLNETKFIDQTGDTVVRTVSSIFIRGIGGFGGEKGPSENFEPPKRNPDAVQVEKTLESQALIYRLSADYNPLHIDPMVASMASFPKPILHGLCTFGFAGRAVLKHFCGDNPSKFKAIKVRFASPVYPGETLITEMWREKSRVFLQVKVQERNVVVINNAYVDIIGEPLSVALAQSPSEGEPPVLKSAIVFEAMGQAIEKHPDIAKKINAVYQFNITGPHATTYTLDLKNGKIYKGPPVAPTTKPECTMTVSDDDYFDMATGKIDSQTAFLKGKVKITGNILLAQKLNLIQQAAAKL